MKTILHKAETRGHANHGWLNAYHTFSFANYYDPERIHFGMLRVLNDDTIAPGMGFGKHPHDNMEIISIALKGALEHQDSMGNTHVIQKNDVQIMSAGSGLYHSERNHSITEEVQLLQIWVLPKKKSIDPRYEQKVYLPADRKNKWQTVVSPIDKEAVWINQDAYFSLTELDGKLEYEMKGPSHGAYIFVLEGEASVGEIQLGKRDGLGISETDVFTLKSKGASILLMEVPMN